MLTDESQMAVMMSSAIGKTTAFLLNSGYLG